MIVDTSKETIDVTVIFERPKSDYLKEQLDYIMDTISELEADYNFAMEVHDKHN